MLPLFQLPSSRRDLMGPLQFKSRRSLLLVFVHDGGCDLCRNLLLGLAEHYPDYQAEEAELLAVAPVQPAEAERLATDLNLPFPVLADADGVIHRRYGAVALARLSGVAIFLADRYGEVQQRWLAEDGHTALPGLGALVDDLRFLGIQCPE